RSRACRCGFWRMTFDSNLPPLKIKRGAQSSKGRQGGPQRFMVPSILFQRNSLLNRLPGLLKTLGPGGGPLGMSENPPAGDETEIRVSDFGEDCGQGSGPIAAAGNGKGRL